MRFYPLRPDLQWDLCSENGNEPLLLAHDPLEYTPQPFAVPAAAYPLLEALATSRSWGDFWRRLHRAGIPYTEQPYIQRFVEELDTQYALLSPRFEERRRLWEAEYRTYPLRTAALAGTCYPAQSSELQTMLASSIASAPEPAIPAAHPIAAVLPHIDLRVGLESYAIAYQVLQTLKPELIVLLGTSHYGWHAPYIVTEKDFQTPLGTLPTARQLVRQLCQNCPDVVTDIDIAHKPEHSLEFHTLFLHYLFGATVEIVPILVTSFGTYVLRRRPPEYEAPMRHFFQCLRELILHSGRRSLWIASADMSHIGPKFGDTTDAHHLLPQAEQHDRALLEAMCHADTHAYFRLIADVGDRYRICGLPPVYTLLTSLQPRFGVVLDYRHWYEAHTSSAVTFASLLYYA